MSRYDSRRSSQRCQTSKTSPAPNRIGVANTHNTPRAQCFRRDVGAGLTRSACWTNTLMVGDSLPLFWECA